MYEADSLVDIEIKCACGEEFTFTVGEQRFMQGLLDDGKITELRQPKRCKECREKKKREQEARG